MWPDANKQRPPLEGEKTNKTKNTTKSTNAVTNTIPLPSLDNVEAVKSVKTMISVESHLGPPVERVE